MISELSYSKWEVGCSKSLMRYLKCGGLPGIRYHSLNGRLSFSVTKVGIPDGFDELGRSFVFIPFFALIWIVGPAGSGPHRAGADMPSSPITFAAPCRRNKNGTPFPFRPLVTPHRAFCHPGARPKATSLINIWNLPRELPSRPWRSEGDQEPWGSLWQSPIKVNLGYENGFSAAILLSETDV